MLAVTAMFSVPCSVGSASIALRKQPVHGTGRDPEEILGTRISGPQCAGGCANLPRRIPAAGTLARHRRCGVFGHWYGHRGSIRRHMRQLHHARLKQQRDEPAPASLMRSTDAASVVAMKVLMEQDEIL